MRRLLMFLFVLSAWQATCLAQGWRGIQPLRSTCDDVKKALNVDKCEYPYSIYRLQDETVKISFVTCPCPITCDSEYGGWNVPFGTVAGITREPRKALSVSEFEVTNTKWSEMSTDMIGEVYYDDHQAGVTLSTINGNILKITYYAPLEKNEHLLCPKCSTPRVVTDNEENSSLWLKGYGDLEFEDEKKFLVEFAGKLRENGPDSVGYIMAFGGCRSTTKDTLQRAERVKKYLIDTHGIPASRIVIVDAGQEQSFGIHLHVRARSQPPPRIFPTRYPANP